MNMDYMKKIINEYRERGCVSYEVEWKEYNKTTWETKKKVQRFAPHLIDEWRCANRKRPREDIEESKEEDNKLIKEEKELPRKRYKVSYSNSNKALRKEIYEKQKSLCNCCKEHILYDSQSKLYMGDIDHIKPKCLVKQGFIDLKLIESFDNKHLICPNCHRIKNNFIDKIVINAYEKGDRYSHSQIIEMLREKYNKLNNYL